MHSPGVVTLTAELADVHARLARALDALDTLRRVVANEYGNPGFNVSAQLLAAHAVVIADEAVLAAWRAQKKPEAR